jgi:hypothetical protein
LKCYSALARWAAPSDPKVRLPAAHTPSRKLPEKAELIARAEIPLTTFNDHFDRRKHPDLHVALGVAPRDGVDRCVLEAKEFTIWPWLGGWRVQVKQAKLAPPVAAEALVRVVGLWAAEHRQLAAMKELELAPEVRHAASEIVGGADCDQFMFLLREAAEVVVDDAGATGITGLNAVRSRLRELTYENGDLRRRSLELSAAIGNFMLLVEGDGDKAVDPQLTRSLALALDELSRPSGDAT